MKLLLLLILLSFQILGYESSSLSLNKQRQIITTEFKGYDISSSERIHLYGAKRRKFINETTYWGEAGYGALFGKRSGYLEGGIIVGKLMDGPFKNSLFDIRFFTGAGGGGSAPQGGGFIVHPTIGLGQRINWQLFYMIEVGYMHFVNGDISSPSIAIAINMDTWKLTERTSR